MQLSNLLLLTFSTSFQLPLPFSPPTRSRLYARHSLAPPLGLILEENVPDAAAGVYVGSLADAGSAVSAGILPGSGIVTINNVDHRRSTFEAVMDVLTNPENAPFDVVTSDPMGREVTLTVVDREGETRVITTTVGSNLRKVLLENDLAVYKGMEKMTNCGGNGNCGNCRFDVADAETEDEGWGPKVGKRRLACMTIVEGGGRIVVGGL